MVRAVNEIGFKPKMIGGGMVGLQNTSIKTQLGPLLNGFTNYDFWLPVPKMLVGGVEELMKKYQARAQGAGVDLLGYYMAPQAFTQMQVLQQAIEATKSLDDNKLADYIRATTFKTVLGDVKFGKDGEWAEPRVLQVQFQNVKGNDPMQFKDVTTQVVVAPEPTHPARSSTPTRRRSSRTKSAAACAPVRLCGGATRTTQVETRAKMSTQSALSPASSPHP